MVETNGAVASEVKTVEDEQPKNTLGKLYICQCNIYTGNIVNSEILIVTGWTLRLTLDTQYIIILICDVILKGLF